MGKRGPKPHLSNTKDRAKLIAFLKKEKWEEIKPSQFAIIHKLTTSYVTKLCREGRIEGVKRIFRYWIIPVNARII